MMRFFTGAILLYFIPVHTLGMITWVNPRITRYTSDYLKLCLHLSMNSQSDKRDNVTKPTQKNSGGPV